MPGPGPKEVFEKFNEFADAVSDRLCRTMSAQKVPVFVMFSNPRTGELTTASTIPDESLVSMLEGFLKEMEEAPKRVINTDGSVIGDPRDN